VHRGKSHVVRGYDCSFLMQPGHYRLRSWVCRIESCCRPSTTTSASASFPRGGLHTITNMSIMCITIYIILSMISQKPKCEIVYLKADSHFVNLKRDCCQLVSISVSNTRLPISVQYKNANESIVSTAVVHLWMY